MTLLLSEILSRPELKARNRREWQGAYIHLPTNQNDSCDPLGRWRALFVALREKGCDDRIGGDLDAAEQWDGKHHLLDKSKLSVIP